MSDFLELSIWNRHGIVVLKCSAYSREELIENLTLKCALMRAQHLFGGCVLSKEHGITSTIRAEKANIP